jgi:hypothetical protein
MADTIPVDSTLAAAVLAATPTPAVDNTGTTLAQDQLVKAGLATSL